MTGKGRVDFSEALGIADDIIKRFTEDETIDKIFLIFAEFKSACGHPEPRPCAAEAKDQRQFALGVGPQRQCFNVLGSA